ncbi:DUF4129 domain-containing protein [Botryobacter ruber]|uniref:DUF4129 domain-containing protein n=1 Tax=Botryobacter ruber TaxID=2171629 RepID=UPI000E0B1A6D|nr:DUF4129 domain-containing protein [Botryobacter ruber]
MRGSTNSIFFYLITFCLLLSAGLPVCARQPDSLAINQPPVVLRLPDAQKLKELQADTDFRYFEEVRPNNTFWERLKYRLMDWLRRIFYTGQSGRFWEILFYAVLVATVVFVIIKMLKADFTGLLGRKQSAATVPYDVLEENIHELDLEELIAQAIDQHEYRKAVRLHYLLSLKKLTDAGFITWKPGKTNRSYIPEIKQQHIRQEFEQLTNMFEYVWYGGAALGNEVFAAARQEFIQFDNLINQHA